MEFIHGGDLRHLLIKNPKKFTWERRISFLCKLAYQLQSLHKENFIHGDFHSGNILCNSDEDFKSISVIITDMGLAGPSDTDKKHNDNEHEALYGVIAYTAPEVLQGQPKSKASDVYAFGIIMWEISSGKPAFYEYDDMVCLKLNVCGGVRPDIVSDTPDCYIELMKRCWAHDPSERPTIEEIIEHLENFSKKSDHSPMINKYAYLSFVKAEKARVNRESNTNALNIDSRYTSKFIRYCAKRNVTSRYQTM